MLVLFGSQDDDAPIADRAALRAALEAAVIRHDLVEYRGARHGFLCDRRDEFDPDAAQDAWRRIDELLDATLS